MNGVNLIDSNLYGPKMQLVKLGSAEQRKKITAFVRGLSKLAIPFFRELNISYFSRGEHAICQNAAIMLARILGARYRLPVARNMPSEVDHIEIAIGIYAPDDLTEAFHQTFLKVYIAGKCFYLDPSLTSVVQDKLSILFRLYEEREFWNGLKRDFKLEPFDACHRAYEHTNIIGAFYRNPRERQKYVELALDVLHSPRLITRSENLTIGFNIEEWMKMDTILRKLEPSAQLPALSDEVEALTSLQFMLLSPLC